MNHRHLFAGACALVLACVALSAPAGAQAPAAPPPTAGGNANAAANPGNLIWAWRPKDLSFKAPMKPVWHIADIKKAHASQSDWSEQVVKDDWFDIRYIQLGVGKKTPMRFQSDTVALFIVNQGQVKFTFKNDLYPAITAGVDTIVSIPARIPYTMETVGSTPSIRFEVQNIDVGFGFPVADNATAPAPPAGMEAVQVNCACATNPPKTDKPMSFDYGAWAKTHTDPNDRPQFPGGPGFFLKDANLFFTTGRGFGAPVPTEDQIGHFHLGLAEWWYALEGSMVTRIEGFGVAEAQHGDIIYSPRGAYHQTSQTGNPSTRTPAGKTGVDGDSGASFIKPGTPPRPTGPAPAPTTAR